MLRGGVRIRRALFDTHRVGSGRVGDGNITTGTINIWDEPDFLDSDAGYYHIGANSGAIDVGVDAGVRSDIDRQPRPYQVPDLGADEYWPPGVLKYVHFPLVMQNR